MMDSKQIAEGLMKAVKAENDGYHFYSMAARNTDDAKGREVFEALAKEEQDHARFLTAQYRSILETGKPDESLKLGDAADLPGASPIFSDAIRKNLKGADREMSALSIGIQLELSSINYYKEQAEAVGAGPVREFYKELVDWELGHYYALLRQEEALKEDYWAQAGFAPF
jgi:rubrerythrin